MSFPENFEETGCIGMFPTDPEREERVRKALAVTNSEYMETRVKVICAAYENRVIEMYNGRERVPIFELEV